MRKIFVVLAALASLLSGCVGYEEGPYRDNTAYRYDRDRDGVPDRRDVDRDGDGVRNSRDRNPDNPRRY